MRSWVAVHNHAIREIREQQRRQHVTRAQQASASALAPVARESAYEKRPRDAAGEEAAEEHPARLSRWSRRLSRSARRPRRRTIESRSATKPPATRRARSRATRSNGAKPDPLHLRQAAPTPDTRPPRAIFQVRNSRTAAPPIHTTQRTASNCSNAAMPASASGRVDQIARNTSRGRARIPAGSHATASAK